MTRKHFEALAHEISKLPLASERLAAAFAVVTACSQFNLAFDPQRFYKACQVTDI